MTGEASLLGKTVFTAEHCNVGAQAIGGGTMTGANGDALAFTYALVSVETVSATPPFVHRFHLAVTFDGGTGRFAGATGSGTFNCLRTIPLDPTTLPAHTPAYANIYDCRISGKVSRPRA